jgi:hypothetical protein
MNKIETQAHELVSEMRNCINIATNSIELMKTFLNKIDNLYIPTNIQSVPLYPARVYPADIKSVPADDLEFSVRVGNC